VKKLLPTLMGADKGKFVACVPLARSFVLERKSMANFTNSIIRISK
jgi:hypothetical protein